MYLFCLKAAILVTVVTVCPSRFCRLSVLTATGIGVVRICFLENHELFVNLHETLYDFLVNLLYTQDLL